ncbi:MAG: tetraacyldisaccharide 4'-kinase [Bacteroidota bacterium]|nr:tetraacyldisaccharide 4'-kinase [Bacteroidota bacterium]
MNASRALLLPFAWLYSLVLKTRHALYDRSVLKSTRPSIPTIVIGNLALGGTGKTPHVELVIEILKEHRTIATLSRGYGRNGTGFHEVQPGDVASLSGDEPLQLKRKFPTVRVFVGADRVRSIEMMQKQIKDLRVAILDDAFQHRRLNASLNILLTTWHRPYYKDALLPAGTLRDVTSRRKAAQLVIVTKCPSLPSIEEQIHWRKQLGLRTDQELFFSGIEYADPYSILDGKPVPIERSTAVLLVTGIADPVPLVEHLRARASTVEHIAFPDHHVFSRKDLDRLADRSAKFAPGDQVLVTTEKDAERLKPLLAGSPIEKIKIAVIGIRAKILNAPERFSALIEEHVGKDQADR